MDRAEMGAFLDRQNAREERNSYKIFLLGAKKIHFKDRGVMKNPIDSVQLYRIVQMSKDIFLKFKQLLDTKFLIFMFWKSAYFRNA